MVINVMTALMKPHNNDNNNNNNNIINNNNRLYLQRV